MQTIKIIAEYKNIYPITAQNLHLTIYIKNDFNRIYELFLSLNMQYHIQVVLFYCHILF